jgi:hypothetical protein
MAFRGEEKETFLSLEAQDIKSVIHEALLYCEEDELTRQFIANNTWERRFADTKIIL